MLILKHKAEQDARYDGKWVLSTNTTLPAEDVARKYKQLLLVEDIFRQTNESPKA